MKFTSRIALLLAFSACCMTAHASNTWYVSPDTGGPRASAAFASANPGAASCTGLGRTAYNSSGSPSQACPYQAATFLWNDPWTTTQTGWVIAGSDTVIFIGNTPTQIGGSQTTAGPGDPCWGVGVGCSPPPVPSGTSGAHTIFEGENFASCETHDSTGFLIADPAKTAYLWAGGSSQEAFDVSTTQYADFKCLNISDHSNCNFTSVSCAGTDWALYGFYSGGAVPATNGHITLTDIDIHGMESRAILGNVGGVWTLYVVEMFANGGAGWDLDPGSGQDSINAVLNMTHVGIDWNGCPEQYPIVDPIPIQTGGCTDDNGGGGFTGYGDGIGTPPDNGIVSVLFDQSRATYNTQDGDDFGHMLQGSLTFSNSYFQGNMGGNIKSGTPTSMTVFNNFVNGNCRAMSAPITGVPTGYNTYLSDFCRANGDQNSFNWNATPSTIIWEFNTLVGYGSVFIDADCQGGSCPGSTFVFRDNTVTGYSNPAYKSGALPGMWNIVTPTTQDHNNFYNQSSCVAASGDISPTCALSPLFTSQPASPISAESQLENYNFYPGTSSPLIHSGVAVGGITTDFYDVTRPNPPSVGAAEPLSAPAGGTVISGTVTMSGTIQ